MKPLLFFSFIAAGLGACNEPESTTGNEAGSFSKDSLLQHIKVLASDSFGGRKPFSSGEAMTVDYMQNAFKQLGLQPGNGNSFVQDVPMVEITPMPGALMHVQSDKGGFDLKRGDDFVVSTQNTDSMVRLHNDELVFAGYGVVAPEYNWNDYAGIDVKGKVVMVMVNDPGFGVDTTIFKGRTMTYYGRWTYKYEEAARQGAKAVLIIHNTEAASYPFSVVQHSWGSSNLYLDKRGDKQYHCALQGWVSADAAKKLLSAAGRDTSLLVSANKRGFKAVSLNEKLSLDVQVKATYNTSHNVIAKLTGSKRPGEYIIYTAHWDHLGIGKPDATGDSIYNGALDNASGSAALIEMARAFTQGKEKPERTILFLSVTAEEQGLLGSEYYAEHPIYPLNKTVADINMDVVDAYDRKKDIVITGQGQNDLEDYVADVAKQQGRYLEAESHPEAGHYFRSDHFCFARVGVPALDCKGGVDAENGGKAAGEKEEDDYTANRYHNTSDEYDSSLTFAGGLQDLQMLFLVGEKLANESKFPGWKEGSEFRSVRDKEMK